MVQSGVITGDIRRVFLPISRAPYPVVSTGSSGKLIVRLMLDNPSSKTPKELAKEHSLIALDKERFFDGSRGVGKW
jgi:hypothetical protein